jgi:hypothetical protein
MKLPRFSIASIMTIIVIVALDLAAIRALDGTSTVIGGLIVFGSMPMASILVLGLPSLVRALVGRGQIRPFLIGFEAVGWTVLLIYTGSAILFPDSVAEHLSKAIQLLPIDFNTPFWQGWQGIIGEMLIVMIPQLVIALIGGWLNQRFKIRIIIERRRTTGHETMGVSGGPRQVSMQGSNPDPATA